MAATDPLPSSDDRVTLVVRALLSLVFAGAGLAKLSGAEEAREAFAHFGYAAWMVFAVGGAELAGAIGLWWRPVARPAALGLVALMVGAAASHLLHDPPWQALPPLLLVGMLFLLVARERAAAR